MNQRTLVLGLAAACSLHAGAAFAQITYTEDVLAPVPATEPSDLRLHASDAITGGNVALYQEASVTLVSALAVDGVPTDYHSSGTIASGTTVQSYLLHSDNGGLTTTSPRGTITFTEPILGVVFNTATLGATDATLGLASKWYSSTPNGTDGLGADRGLESPDTFSISGETLTFSLSTAAEMNEMRIITAVPEPTTMVAGALLMLPLGASVLRKLRKNQAV